ncbi:MAG: metal-dependent transcriptional regulator [Chloroflexi bacterium]|nr:metal-dependent transcriptional regulator [Chloroflexota bacterium]
MISRAIEDYVKAIFQLRVEGHAVTTSALADALGISNASATNMIKKLAKLKLARHSPYRGVELTRAGEKIALEIIRHHRLIETFLTEALGVPWDRVHAEAEKIEHVISEDLEERIANFLGNPRQDPHGDPIPSKALEIEPCPLRVPYACARNAGRKACWMKNWRGPFSSARCIAKVPSTRRKI